MMRPVAGTNSGSITQANRRENSWLEKRFAANVNGPIFRLAFNLFTMRPTSSRIFHAPVRHAFIAIGALIGIASIARAQPTPSPSKSSPRPNILWILAEDFSPHLGCYGEKNVTSPNLDRLAAEGVRFDRAFTTAPVCSASRSAFMTGMYQTTIGAHNHRSHRTAEFPLPTGVRVLTDWLRDAGYFTVNIRALPAPITFKGAGKTDWNFYYAGKPFDSDQWADLKTRQPFYAQINLSETHRNAPSTVKTGRAYTGPRRVDPAQVEIPPYYPDCPEVRADWANYLDDASALDVKVGALLAQLERDGLADNTVVIFMGDHGQSHVRGKQWCYDSGLRVPLIMRWPKKFPLPAGFKPGTPNGQLVEAIDLTATTLAFAGAPKPAAMQGRVLFGPRAEPARPYAFGARDRCDETVFRLRTARDERYRYIKNFTPEKPFYALSRYKENQYVAIPAMRRLHELGKLNAVQEVLFAPHMVSEELYDLAADPHEIVNLVASPKPEHQAALKRLRAALENWIETTNDQGRVFESAEEIQKIDDGMEAWSRRTFNRRFNDKPDSALPAASAGAP
jgi:N-sulfoglucosamine sulfohydrolase